MFTSGQNTCKWFLTTIFYTKNELEIRKLARKMDQARRKIRYGSGRQLDVDDLDDPDEDNYMTGNRNIVGRLSKERVDDDEDSDGGLLLGTIC